MKLYFAPLDGLNNRIYRDAHARHFGGADLYFTPFYAPTTEGLTKKSLADLSLGGLPLPSTVPQLLCRNPEHFMLAVAQLANIGYTHVNLNLGCPSGTVTAKYKGSGFLTVPDELDRFFDTVFSAIARDFCGMELSVKTRVGYASEEEAPRLLAIYNRYPIAELTVHPRLRADIYRGKPRMRVFDLFAKGSRAPVCYNGDIFSVADYRKFTEAYPAISRVMIGRGAVANPALFLECKDLPVPDKKARLRAMHDEILERNYERMGEGRNLVCRMADIWNYQIYQFFDTPLAARELHRAKTVAEYRAAANKIFREAPLRENGAFVQTLM